MSTVHRSYALTKVAPGDYLFPSNDGKTLWRVTSYQEDGSAEYVDANGHWRKVLGTFWGVTYYTGPGEIVSLPDDFLEWENWDTSVVGLRTRAQAIEEVLA